MKHKQFVNDSLRVIIVGLPIGEVEQPKFINLLHVAFQSSGELRFNSSLIVLSLFFSFLMKKSCKYEDLKVALQFFEKGNFVFAFDLKSAYHNIAVTGRFLDNTFLQLEFDGVTKYFQFNVLVLRDAETPYMFVPKFSDNPLNIRGYGLFCIWTMGLADLIRLKKTWVSG